MAVKFRKVFIVCEDNQIFKHISKTDIFKHKDSAEWRCDYLQKKAEEEQVKVHQQNNPMPRYRVHAFFWCMKMRLEIKKA